MGNYHSTAWSAKEKRIITCFNLEKLRTFRVSLKLSHPTGPSVIKASHIPDLHLIHRFKRWKFILEK